MGIIKAFRSSPRITPALALSGVLTLALAGCGGDEPEGGGEPVDPEAVECEGEPVDDVTIAYQPGLGYASLLMAKQQGALKEALPDVQVEFRELNSGAAIRDGMISKEIHVGSGGIGPFVVGFDGGVDWKVLAGMNNMSLHLMAMDESLQSLEDLDGAGSIAMPGPDSIQAVVLRKAAQEELGDAKALDDQIVAMGHPDGVQALVAGQIAAHLTSPPFQSQEAEQGAHKILESYDVFGQHTFNSVFTTTDFAACNPEFVDALVGAIQEANQMLTDDPAQAASILEKEMGIPAADIEEQITSEGVSWETTPSGFGAFAAFMAEIGLISEAPETGDMFFDTEATEGAS